VLQSIRWNGLLKSVFWLRMLPGVFSIYGVERFSRLKNAETQSNAFARNMVLRRHGSS
jgi:hypothetical protein